MQQRPPLYGKTEAECLQIRETTKNDDQKYGLLLEHMGSPTRLVDIGCGWGQFLSRAADRVAELWGVDESPERIADVAKVCPKAKMVTCRADALELPDGYFDVVVTSQMLHEVKLFGEPGELVSVLGEIYRVLKPGGRYLLLDHQDAGDGEVAVRLPNDQLDKLATFEAKYEFYRATHESLGDGQIRITKRCLQDFLTKDWSIGSSMESIEMNETHNVFAEAETCRQVADAGFRVSQWIDFEDIARDLADHGCKLAQGEPWYRKFVLVADKP